MFRKLSPPIPSAEIDTKLRHVKSPEDIPACVILDPFYEISKLFELPPPQHVHIVVVVPPTREYPRHPSILPVCYRTSHIIEWSIFVFRDPVAGVS